mgnify:CR=1 FL=1
MGTSGAAGAASHTFFARLAAAIPARSASRFSFSVPLGTRARTARSMAFGDTIGQSWVNAPRATILATTSFFSFSRAMRVNGT